MTPATTGNEELFRELILALLASNEDKTVIDKLTSTVEEINSTQGTKDFKGHYQSFMSALADHMQVLGPVVAPFLPALSTMLP